MTVALNEHYDSKPAQYYFQVNEPLLQLVNRRGLRVLDVGCGAGANGRKLLESGLAVWCAGVELVEDQAHAARAYLHDVQVGMVDEMTFPWGPTSFDCLIFGDVLEHVVDPWKLLGRLTTLLKPGGMAVASIPNVQHISVLWDLAVNGEWQYHHDGILDSTHLRFFTRRSSVRLFEDAGYTVEVVRPYFSGRRYSWLSRPSGRLLDGWLAQRWLIRAILSRAE